MQFALAAPPADGAAHTRDRVARALLEGGPATAATLAATLGLTAAGVRRHLDALAAAGLAESREPRAAATRGRGRPARLFGLTDAGRESFDSAYDDLAASALRFLRERAGESALAEFARQRFADLERRHRDAVTGAPPERRVDRLAEALTADGYAASARPLPRGGAQLCQHHCPVAHVAGQFPELCEAETEVFARLLGTHVQRLATIAHGDGVCTTYVPTQHLAPHPESATPSGRTAR